MKEEKEHSSSTPSTKKTKSNTYEKRRGEVIIGTYRAESGNLNQTVLKPTLNSP